MPSGGFDDDDNWKSTAPGFVLPVKRLSIVFREEFERLVGKQAAEYGLPSSVFRLNFVSFAKPVGDGVATLKYLSRYMFRTAITNDRIVGLNETHVSFTYRKKSKRPNGEPSVKGPRKTMPLPAMEFLRRFLQHVLPRGLQRVRHYGFLSRASKRDLDKLRSIILDTMADSDPDLELIDWTVPVLQPSRGDASGPLCPTCGSELTFDSFIRIRPPPLEWRTAISMPTTTRFAKRQN